ncbi:MULTISPECIES: hypothetical protein [Enterobacteriaceae]|uniref:Uncharacterized protein n=4 Tax=Enterobacteriaceae TaxID=543 RepID=A0AB35RIU7_9ENTR|nr:MULTISPECIES: hypothetical protein [Enterobacteriaceae]MCL5498967.1 hypothetical protein [Escherichia coli]MDU4151296.1 hypothetical protein [Enterobacteriaceae bacterium]MBY6259709.1 hypothetical protein [Phytobacter diazotrophicus]MCL9672654.1 hypothetical protein [Citrobacter sp. MNAZ 1397]MDC0723933.1 hypothetical protein [Phytobacter diazotrophicus]
MSILILAMISTTQENK